VTEQRHECDVVVWDVPSVINAGAAFRVKVGAKCRAACVPDGWPVEIRDHDGRLAAEAVIGPTAWPASAGLYFVEIGMHAPETAGLFAWEVVVAAAGDNATVHEAARAVFHVRSMPTGDCQLRVVAVDRASQAPVEGVRVVVHPYRAVTDRHGCAELCLPAGQYRLFVSGKDYFPYRTAGTLEQDLTIRAELEPDAGPTDAELWT